MIPSRVITHTHASRAEAEIARQEAIREGRGVSYVAAEGDSHVFDTF